MALTVLRTVIYSWSSTYSKRPRLAPSAAPVYHRCRGWSVFPPKRARTTSVSALLSTP
jgi:hypothetical protein